MITVVRLLSVAGLTNGAEWTGGVKLSSAGARLISGVGLAIGIGLISWDRIDPPMGLDDKCCRIDGSGLTSGVGSSSGAGVTSHNSIDKD